MYLITILLKKSKVFKKLLNLKIKNLFNFKKKYKYKYLSKNFFFLWILLNFYKFYIESVKFYNNFLNLIILFQFI